MAALPRSSGPEAHDGGRSVRLPKRSYRRTRRVGKRLVARPSTCSDRVAAGDVRHDPSVMAA